MAGANLLGPAQPVAIVAQQAFHFDLEDYNGELFVAGSEGERDEHVAECTVICPVVDYWPGDYGGVLPLLDANGHARPERADMLETMLYMNIAQQISIGVGEQDACRVAYIRVLAARDGLISPGYLPQNHHVRYTDAVIAVEWVYPERCDRARSEALATQHLPGRVRENIRRLFYDLVAIVAFVFRARGHHWMQQLDDLYRRVWEKCLHQPADAPLPWNLLARNALHAIFPEVLDWFWQDAAEADQIAGALKKRVSCAAAGTAALFTLERGIIDLEMVLPGALARQPEVVTEIRQLCDRHRERRWHNSVNARYYGDTRPGIDESRMAAIGAIIRGCLEQFAAESPLLASASLQRIASSAPITGGVIARMAQVAVTTPAAAMSLLPAEAIEQYQAMRQ